MKLLPEETRFLSECHKSLITQYRVESVYFESDNTYVILFYHKIPYVISTERNKSIYGWAIYIHNYNHYNPSVRITSYLLTPLMLYALILYMSGGTYSLMSIFHGRFIYSQSLKSAERKSPKNYFFFLYWDTNLGLRLCNVGLILTKKNTSFRMLNFILVGTLISKIAVFRVWVTVWSSLWTGGIIGPYLFETDVGAIMTVNGSNYFTVITDLFLLALHGIDMNA